MRRVALCLFLMALPLVASATAPLAPGKHWHDCAQDADCVVVQGICDLTAVNVVFKDQAIAYYRQQAETVRCVKKFWEPKEQVSRCRLGWCETIPKQPAQ